MSKKEVAFWMAGFLLCQSELFESILNFSDWLDKSRASKNATSFFDM